MNIGIIGAAEMGSLLATKLVALGHDVSIANSRGPATLFTLANEVGAKAVSVSEVTKDKDIIIISIPLKNIPDLPKVAFEKLPDNVVVIETCNYYPTLRDGDITALQQSGIDSLWVQQVLGVNITKVFNSILATSLATLGKRKNDKDRIAIAVSGDNLKSKQVAFKIADDFGFDSFDIGAISQSWKQQPGSSIYCRNLSLDELRKRVDAMGNDLTEMRNIILTKRKSDEILMRENYPEYLKNLKSYRMKKEKDFTTSILVNKSSVEVFNAVNNVRGWWQGKINGNTEKLNDEFIYQMETIHLSKQKIIELIPNKKVVWQVTESDLSFVDKTDEWTGTTIIFDIQPEGNKTKLTFTHHGLVPSFECYDGCSSGWAQVIEKSLFSFINTGKGVDVFN